MKKSGYYLLVTASYVGLLMTVAGCQTQAISSTPATEPASTKTPSAAIQTSVQTSVQTAAQQTLAQQAQRIQTALANGDYDRIITDIHPMRGVRFSMYAYVRPESDKVFSRAQFAQYLKEPKIRFTWGDLDGTGELLIIPLPTYLNTWVDAKKFNNSQMTVNHFESRGNMINNVKNIYQHSDVVDFYYKGTDEYSGMDWRGMRLVFDDYQGQRYLVAIINDQWTV